MVIHHLLRLPPFVAHEGCEFSLSLWSETNEMRLAYQFHNVQESSPHHALYTEWGCWNNPFSDGDPQGFLWLIEGIEDDQDAVDAAQQTEQFLRKNGLWPADWNPDKNTFHTHTTHTMHTTLDQIQAARAQLLAARKPFDDALAALDQAESHANHLRRQMISLFEGLNPEWENSRAIDQWLREGVFPAVYTARGADDLRIDGALTQPNSLIKFLKDNMKESGPVWVPGGPIFP